MFALDSTVNGNSSLEANIPHLQTSQTALLEQLWATRHFQGLLHNALDAATRFKAAELDVKNPEQQRLKIFVETLSGPEATQKQRDEVISYG